VHRTGMAPTTAMPPLGLWTAQLAPEARPAYPVSGAGAGSHSGECTDWLHPHLHTVTAPLCLCAWVNGCQGPVTNPSCPPLPALLSQATGRFRGEAVSPSTLFTRQVRPDKGPRVGSTVRRVKSVIEVLSQQLYCNGYSTVTVTVQYFFLSQYSTVAVIVQYSCCDRASSGSMA